MCGISACLNVSDNTSITSVTNALTKLQNRGYDSAGICAISENKFVFKKSVSQNNVNAIQDLLADTIVKQSCRIAIGHTRWATHGRKTIENAHPHFDQDKRFALVHNGIIENYSELKKYLIGYPFYGETDTEIVVSYLSHITKLGLTINQLSHSLKGSWAIVYLDRFDNNRIYYLKNGSPLIMGFNDTKTKVMFVSELVGFDPDITTYCVIQDNDYGSVYCTENKFIMVSQFENVFTSVKKIGLELTPSPFDYWTIKEIHDQPVAIRDLISERISLIPSGNYVLNFPELEQTINNHDIEHIILLGCGTSYHAANIGKKYIREFRPDITVEVIDGADFENTDIIHNRKTLLVLLSQSGETKDLYRALCLGKQNNLLSIGIINVENSLIAREVDTVLYLRAGREHAVASTKSFTNQIVMLLLFGLYLGSRIRVDNWNQYLDCVIKLADEFDSMIKKSLVEIPLVIKFFEKQHNCFLLGKFHSEWIAKEGSLKIKEISYIHAEGYSAAALKHGPFALLEPKIPVILLATDDSYFTKIENINAEIRSRQATVILITNKKTDSDNVDYLFYYPTNSILFPIISIVPLQIMAYFLATDRGLDPDYPRNLAKVVTVE